TIFLKSASGGADSHIGTIC
ncbi:unnamed protein product, partial [Allacma fusca]